MIFNMSSQVGAKSADLSAGITKIIVETLEKLAPSVDWGITNHIIRKCAHFFAYLVLGLLVINAMRWSGIKSIKIVLLICILYAASDEVHQIFVPDRGPAVKDVLIDSAGSSVGVLVYIGLSKIKHALRNIKSVAL